MLITVAQENNISDLVDEAAAKYPRAQEIFDAAIWRIARQPDCGQSVGEASPERRLIYLPPIKDSKSPGLLVRYYLPESTRAVIDWIKYYDYSDKEAVSPREYVIGKKKI